MSRGSRSQKSGVRRSEDGERKGGRKSEGGKPADCRQARESSAEDPFAGSGGWVDTDGGEGDGERQGRKCRRERQGRQGAGHPVRRGAAECGRVAGGDASVTARGAAATKGRQAVRVTLSWERGRPARIMRENVQAMDAGGTPALPGQPNLERSRPPFRVVVFVASFVAIFVDPLAGSPCSPRNRLEPRAQAWGSRDESPLAGLRQSSRQREGGAPRPASSVQSADGTFAASPRRATAVPAKSAHDWRGTRNVPPSLAALAQGGLHRAGALEACAGGHVFTFHNGVPASL
jgi:hypothetical protein